MTTSAVAWTSRATDVRRRQHRIAMLAVTVGLVVAAVAVVAVVHHLTWPDTGTSTGLAPVDEPGEVTPEPASDRGEGGEPTVEAEREATVDPASSPGGDVAPSPTSRTPSGAGGDADAGNGGDAADAPAAGDVSADGGAGGVEAPGTDDQGASPSATGTLGEVQERLHELGYLVGPADGRRGQQTVAAVMAFQSVQGLRVDGVVGPRTWAAIDGEVAKPTLRGGPATRIEVDLDRQVLHLIEADERVITLKVSSGSGAAYRTASGGMANARTPVGDFEVERRIAGERIAPLGVLYDPLYFHRGFAIHGSPSVPAGPASHGCVRVSRADARWLFDRVPDGIPVQLHGGTHVFSPFA